MGTNPRVFIGCWPRMPSLTDWFPERIGPSRCPRVLISFLGGCVRGGVESVLCCQWGCCCTTGHRTFVAHYRVMFCIMTYSPRAWSSTDQWACSHQGRANLEASEASLDGLEVAERHLGTTNPSKPPVLAPPPDPFLYSMKDTG